MAKRILLEFVGGYWDGKTIDSTSQDPQERQWVRNSLFLYGERHNWEGVSRHIAYWARILAQEHGMDAARAAGVHGQHVYRVIERLEEGDEVLVRLKYELL